MTNSQTSPKQRSLSVVMPVFNEEVLVRSNIECLENVLSRSMPDHEIIAVNDGSTDGTAAILKKMSAEIKGLKVLTLSPNQGLGAAMAQGFSAASKELVLYTDIDKPVDYAEIAKAVELLEECGADMVFGARKNKVYESFSRFLCSVIYNRLIRFIFKVKTREINFAFKLFTQASLQKIHLKSKGSFAASELVIRAEASGGRIAYAEVDFFPRRTGRSRLFNLKAIARLLIEMIRCYPELQALKQLS